MTGPADLTASQRRRLSTIVFPTNSLDVPSSPTSLAPSICSNDNDPLSSSKSINSSLKPPPSSHSTSRNSLGMWSGSKSAASTPNLSNMMLKNDFFEFSVTTTVKSNTNHPSQLQSNGSGSGSGSRAVASSASSTKERETHSSGAGNSSNDSSFNQRRKRSESIGGFKSTAGNISRIVRKSSSNFLKKLVKNFDDKDAPPTPMIPTLEGNSNNSAVSHISTSSSSTLSMTVSNPKSTLPPLPLLPTAPSSQRSGFGPLDAPPTIPEGDTAPSTTAVPTPIPAPKHLEIDTDQELSNSVSTVESWLKRADSDLNDSTPASTTITLASSPIPTVPSTTSNASGVSIADATTTGKDTSSDLRRPSHTSSVMSTDEELEEENINASLSVLSMGTKRLSHLYETASLHRSQSQTSLYYSTRSNISADDADPALGTRATLGQGIVAGGALGHGRNSVRLSGYGLALTKDLPAIFGEDEVISATDEGDGKPLPKRPASLLPPLNGITQTGSIDLDDAQPNAPVASDGVVSSEFSKDETTLLRSLEPLGPSIATPGLQRHSSLSGRIQDHSSLASLPPLPTAELVQREQDLNRTLGADLRGPGHPFSGASGSLAPRPTTICITPLDASLLNISSGITPISQPLATTNGSETESTDILAFQASKRCFEEDETFLRRGEISTYLGSVKPFNRLVLSYYMANFNFSSKRLDHAFRSLCHKLVLKGETQEVDRILEAFAERYVDCNPQSILGSKDVVHAISYSILLLNTDLHVVQQSTRMSRSAFVKNTMHVVQEQTQMMNDRPSEDSSAHGLTLARTGTGELSVHGYGSGKKKTPSVKSWKSGASHQSRSGKMGLDPKANGGYGNGKWWQSELESLLKDIYTAVKQNQILLPLGSSTGPSQPVTPTSSFGFFPPSSNSTTGSTASPPNSSGSSKSLAVGLLPRIGRHGQSATSPVELGFGSGFLGGLSGPHQNGLNGMSSAPNSSGGSKFGLGRRNSVNTGNARTRQLRMDAMQRLNDRASGNIPEHESLAVAGAHVSQNSSSSASTNSLRLMTPPVSSTHSPASSIMSTHNDTDSHVQSQQPGSNGKAKGGPHLSKPTMTNAGLHYRMEGILHRKHLLERADKKAQNRSWKQLLVVVDPENGTLSMFRADGALGQAFEEQGILFDEIRLQHTITQSMPAGYSASRPNVFVVQLQSGAVYLFQTKTLKERDAWTKACNYWAARTSKEPLPGGVINMDYGWGRCLDLLNNSYSSYPNDASMPSSPMFPPPLPPMPPVSSSSLSSSYSSNGMGHSNTMSSITSVSTTSTSGATMSTTNLNGNGSGASLAVPAAAAVSNGTESEIEDDRRSVNTSNSFLNHPPPSSQVVTPLPAAFTGNSSGIGNMGSGIGYNFGQSGIGSGRSASIKSSKSSHGAGNGAVVPLGDRVVLFDWAAPMPTMSLSTLSEEDQLAGLKRYLEELSSDLDVHSAHNEPMTRLFLPKTQNYTKAFNNWEGKRGYLTTEMVKYHTYIESLEQAIELYPREPETSETDKVQVRSPEMDSVDGVTAAAAATGLEEQGRMEEPQLA